MVWVIVFRLIALLGFLLLVSAPVYVYIYSNLDYSLDAKQQAEVKFLVKLGAVVLAVGAVPLLITGNLVP